MRSTLVANILYVCCFMGLAVSWAWSQETAPAPDTAPAAETAPASEPVPAAVEVSAPASEPAEPQTPPAPVAEVPPAAASVIVMPPTPPAVSTAPAAGENSRNIRFQFDGVAYNDVVRRFAQMAGRPLIGDVAVEGTLTFFDSQPYSYDEAFDTLNLLLSMRGYALMETGRFLRLVPLSQVSQMPLKIRKGEGSLEGVRPGEVVTVVLPVKFLSADEAAKAVVRMVSSFGSISPLGKGKGIVITDTRASIERVKALLAEMDSGEMVDHQMKTYPLKRASAKAVAAIINNLFGRATAQARRGPPQEGQPQQPSPDAVLASHDERANIVVLVGAGDKLALAEQMIHKLDTAEVPDNGEMRIFALKSAKAEELARTVQGALPRTVVGRDQRGQIQYATEARVVPDMGTNRLLVSAPVDQMASIEKVIRELDQATQEMGGVRVIALKLADAQQVAGVVANAVNKRDSRGRVEARVQVSADPRTNSLIVSGPAGELQAASNLVAELDRKPEGEVREIHVIQLKAGDARQLARSLERLFAEQAAQGGKGGASGSNLKVEGEANTNSLMISAAPGDWPTVEGILNQLQASVVPQMTPTTRLAPLKFAKAGELATTLTQIYNPKNGRRDSRTAVPVVIAASDRSNSLLISAAQDDQKAIAELIAAMDVESVEKMEPVRMIRLTSADAASLAAKLQAMMPAPARGEGRAVMIQADKLTNSVLLRAPEGERKVLEEIIAQLDQATRQEARETRVLGLKNSSAQAMAAMLSQLYASPASSPQAGRRNAPPAPGDTAGEVVVVAGASDKALIVEGPRPKVEQIAQLVAGMDADHAGTAVQVRTYDLKSSNVGEVARSLARLFAKQRSQRNGPQTGEFEPRFEADAGSNTLFVAATAEQFAEIDALIEKVQAATVLASTTRTFQLKFAKSGDVAAVLEAMLSEAGGGRDRRANGARPAGAAARVAAMESSNAVVVQGTAEQVALADELIKTFDVESNSAQQTIQIVRLAKANAQTLAQSVTASLGQQAQGRPRQGGVTAQTPVSVTAETNSNSVIVRGAAAEVPAVVEMIRKLDTDSVSDQIAVRVYPLAHGEAAQLATSLSKLFRDIVQQQGRGARNAATAPFSISSDDRTNSLVVSTTPAHFVLVEELLKSLDQAPERSTRDVQYVWLENADAWEVASRISAMYSSRRGVDKPLVEPDSFSNSLTVIARPADLKEIEPIIAKMDAAARDNNIQVRVVPLTSSRAEKMAELLQRVYGQMTDSEIRIRDRADAASPGTLPGASRFAAATQPDSAATTAAGEAKLFEPPAPPVTITVDKTSNSLILSATRRELDAMEQLIAKLSVGAGEGDAELHVVPIKQADPTVLAKILDDLFNPKSRTAQPAQAQGNQPQRQQPNAQPQRGGRQNTANTPAVATQTVTVVADVRTRSLIVRARPMEWEMIEPIIARLDQAATVVSEVRVFTLKNSDATEVAANLKELFRQASAPSEPAGRTGEGDNGPNAQQRRAEMLRQMIELRQAETATKAEGAMAISISANRKSNSVVVAAPAEAMELVQRLVQELDQSAAATAVPAVRIYPLKYADVRTTVASLQQVFAGGAAARGRGAAASPASDRETPVQVAGDESARLIIVSASADKHELIAKIVKEVDESQAGDDVTVKIYRVAHADAVSLSSALVGAMGADASSGRNSRSGPGGAGLRISADASSNSVVARASREDHERLAKLIDEMDVAPTAKYPVQLIQLTHADAAGVASALNAVFGGASSGSRGRGQASVPQVVIQADRDSRTLMVRADEQAFEKIRQMAAQLDQAPATGGASPYVLALKNGSAAQVATMIRDLYNQQAQTARADRRTLDPLAVSADARANALVLTTTKGMYEQVSQWVTQIEQMKPARGGVRLITLEHADPAEVQKAIQQMFGQETPSAGPSAPAAPSRGTGRSVRGSRGDDQIETSVLSKQQAILVTASDEDYETIVKLVEAMDRAAEGKRLTARVFQLKHADNTRIAAALTALYKVSAGRDRPEDAVSVAALPQTTAIVVTASKEKLEEVEHLVSQLDRAEVSPQLEFRIYPVKNTMPTKILPTLSQMLAQVQRARPDQPINVQADERTRSIIVTARGPVFDQVEQIIQTLDKAPAYEKAEVAIIPLKRTDAQQLAVVLNEMLRPNDNRTATPEARALQEQVRLLRVRGGADLEEVPELDLTKPIKVQADSARQNGSNALVITSTPDNLKAMRAVVSILDAVPLTDGARIRVIALANADAASVVQVVREIFLQGKQLAGKQGTPVAGRAEPANTSGKALVDVLNASADLRTNTVVLSGSDESVALAEVVVRDLDREDGKIVMDVKAFRLQHADAEKLAPVLRAVFAESGNAVGMEGLRTQVSRLRTLAGKTAHTTTLPKSRPALTIQADSATNILLVAARSDVMPLIADVVKSMDVAGAGSLNSVRIFPLAHADATRIKQVVTDLYSGPNSKLLRSEDLPTISVDTRTNALIISANDKTFALIESLLKTLDDKQAIDTRDIRLMPLKNADATTLAATLQKMMDARVQRQSTLGARDTEALKTLILADPRSNSLIVGGSAESFELVKALADQLDGASPALSGQIQVLTLTHGNAGTLAATLTGLFDQRYQAAATKDVQRQKPIILPDLRTNCLLVAAGNDDSKILLTLLEKLDVEIKDPAVSLTVIPMKHNDSGVVGPMLQKIFAARLTSMTAKGQTPEPQNRVDIATDGLSNALVVSASKENLALICGLLEKVDVEPSAESGLVKIYGMNFADAPTMATMLQGLISKGLYKPGAASAGANATLAAREKVAIVADVRTNVLIVSASKENLAIIEEIITRLDRQTDPLLGDIRVYTLKQADATKLGTTLQQFFNAKRQSELAVNDVVRVVPVVIIPDTRTNSLLVAGGKETFASVEAMIKQLDGDGMLAANEYRVFYLKNATAAAVQPTLQTLFNQRIVRGQQKDPMTVIADAKSNALVVGASPEDMKLAADLIAKIDAGPDRPGYSVQVFPLERADAAAVVKNIQSLLQSEGTKLNTGLGISADERTNAVVVSGGENDVRRIGELVAQLDREASNNVTEIRVFSLENADASELASILNDALNSKPKALTSLSPNRQSLLQFITKDKDGREIVASALQEGVLITPDRRSNALVVSAPIHNMPMLASLIHALDTTSPRTAEIRVFQLVNADARRMADVLTELFQLRATGSSSTRPSAGGGATSVNYTLVCPDPAGDKGVASATLGTAEQYALRITVDLRTNSLLVGGTTKYVELVSGMIRQLDACPAQERMTEVYRLKNAQARDIQTALRSFLDQERQRLVSTLGQDAVGNAQRLLEHEVAVVAVQSSETQPASTNTLLLSASPRYFKTIRDMISELDQPPPQVLIQVLLAEVALDNKVDLGVDWSYSTTDSDGRTYGAAQNLGVRGEYLKFGGFSLSVTGGDLTFFLRALQAQGKLEILSRPQILASDNQSADINVGQRVPFVTNSRVTDNGSVFNTIQYEDVGIILRVTPRINPEGFVRLEVSPEISSLSDSTVQISEGVSAPIINSRRARTTVTVQDGHTIVIGGLITTKDENREDKVPVLGDIPLLGYAFKSTKVTKERSELLIILTPYVIRCPGDADAATKGQIDRLNLLRGMDPEALKKVIYAPLHGQSETKLPGCQPPPAAPAAEDVPPTGKMPTSRAAAEAPRTTLMEVNPATSPE